MFWISVPVGIFGTLWAHLRLRDDGERHRGKVDWWGNLTFAAGLGAVLVGITTGIQPYRQHTMGWTDPLVIALLAGGMAGLVAFTLIESRVAEPMFRLSLFKIRAFTAGSIAGLLVSIARGGHPHRRAAVRLPVRPVRRPRVRHRGQPGFRRQL